MIKKKSDDSVSAEGLTDESVDDSASVSADDSSREKELAVLDALRSEIDELKDKALRAHAEMENLRRRTAKEVSDARSYGVTSFARDMISVVDNLERALSAVPDVKRKEGSAEFKAFIEGVEMTQKQFLQGLESNGVSRLDPTSERFDPNFHQAMFEVTDSGLADGMVAEVVQAGYVIDQRVIRPALVGVAKGGSKGSGKSDNRGSDEDTPKVSSSSSTSQKESQKTSSPKKG